MVYNLPSRKEAMVASKKCIMGDSSTANSTEDSTVDSPVSNQLVGSRAVKRTRVELSKDEGVEIHVSEDANVLSDPSGAASNADTDSDSDVDSETDSDVDSLTSPLEHNSLFDSPSPYGKSISDLKKEMAEIEEEVKYNKEKLRTSSLELARLKAENEKLVQLRKEEANRGGVVGTDHIDQVPKE